MPEPRRSRNPFTARRFLLSTLPFQREKHTKYPRDSTAHIKRYVYRLDLATRSSSSFFLMASELLLPLAALMSSSARHSAMDLTLRKAASRAPVVRRAMAWLTLRRGETSTA